MRKTGPPPSGDKEMEGSCTPNRGQEEYDKSIGDGIPIDKKMYEAFPLYFVLIYNIIDLRKV